MAKKSVVTQLPPVDPVADALADVYSYLLMKAAARRRQQADQHSAAPIVDTVRLPDSEAANAFKQQASST